MPEKDIDDNVGILLKKLLNERSLSMRKFSERTEIDTATISRIINGKRKAKPEHLQSFANCLDVPVTDFFIAAGYQLEQKQRKTYSDDIYSSVDSINTMLESSNLYQNKFAVERVETELEKYEQFSQTEEGRKTILNGFEKKLEKLGSIGPFINHLKDMFEKYCLMNGSPHYLAILGSALLYFIFPVDVIPDYIFPIGYLDDAVAVQIALDSLKRG